MEIQKYMFYGKINKLQLTGKTTIIQITIDFSYFLYDRMVLVC